MDKVRLLFLLLILVLASCSNSSSNDNTEAIEARVSCSQTIIEAPVKGGSYEVAVVASAGGWTATADESCTWLKVSTANANKATGTVTISVDENTSTASRSGNVNVQMGTKQVSINVNQAGRTVTPIDGGELVVPEGYELVWSDEFNEGSELNSTDWTHQVADPGWVNNELQTYVNGSAGGKRVTEIADNRLYIHCFKGSDGKVYSGRVYAHEGEGWQYGIMEARIKLPQGKGTWPAFWMMPCNNDFSKTPWPLCGEIDIMEEVGVDANKTSSSLHTQAYNHVNNTQKTAERLTEGAEDGFHVYRLEWTHEYIKTYVDGELLLSFDNDGKNDVNTWPFDKPFYIILNLAWGGDWGGYKGIDESALPATMEVDYVRVFQKKK